MSFSKSACIVRKLYCGDGNIPKDTAENKYSRRGSSYECLKKGFGIADWEHRKKGLSKTSLQQIMYIGPAYEANFKKLKIYSIKSLLSKMDKLSSKEKKTIIVLGCTRKNGTLDQRAYNAVVLFLHDNGQIDLPACKIVKE